MVRIKTIIFNKNTNDTTDIRNFKRTKNEVEIILKEGITMCLQFNYRYTVYVSTIFFILNNNALLRKNAKYFNVQTQSVNNTLYKQNLFREVLPSVACPALQYFPTLSHKPLDFRKKKSYWTQNVCFDFSTILVWNILHSRNNWTKYDKKCISVFMYNAGSINVTQYTSAQPFLFLSKATCFD